MIGFILDVFDELLAFSPWLRRIRDRRQEWTGTVEAKRTSTLSRHGYLVIFRTDEGRRKKVLLDWKEDFDIYQEGRRYAKNQARSRREIIVQAQLNDNVRRQRRIVPVDGLRGQGAGDAEREEHARRR